MPDRGTNKRNGSTSVTIITDSAACLPGDIAERYGIQIVPMEFIHEGRTYRDGVDITAAGFYELLAKSKRLPTTSAPSPDAYLRAFKAAAEKSTRILVITPATRFTHAFESARTAAEMSREKIPAVAVEVLDCGTAAGAQGFIVLAAARAALHESDPSSPLQAARHLMPRVRLIAFIDTLDYLAKGGRVPHAVAWANSLLRIKPIFELLPSGKGATPLDRVRIRPKAIDRLVQILRQRSQGNPVHVLIMHTNVLAEAEELKERISSEFDCAEIYVTDFTPVMGLHTGPGLLGLAFYSDGSLPTSSTPGRQP
jgi:DegV family protein with EDD domain